jgi:replicative DNA helicase
MKSLEANIPVASDLEKSLLSCLMLKPALSGEVNGNLFWDPAHRMIFESIQDLKESGVGVDFGVLVNHLSDRGLLDDVGGREGLNEIWSSSPTPDGWRYYAQNLDRVRLHRESVISAIAILQAPTAKEALAEVEKLTQSKAMVAGSVRHIKDVLQDTLGWLDAKRDGHARPRVQFGIEPLDRQLWIEPGNLIVISAQTGGGKTALAVQSVIESPRTKWAIFSLEMEGEAIGARVLANAGSISLQNLRAGRLKLEEREALCEAIDEQSKRSVWLDDSQLTVSQIADRCRSLQRSHGLEAIVVDYLQIINPSVRKEESRQQQVAEISRSLKNLAMELRIVVVTMSQLNDEGRLRESRAIGQDADLVINVAEEELSIQKHRNGPKGIFPIKFLGEYTRFVSAK